MCVTAHEKTLKTELMDPAHVAWPSVRAWLATTGLNDDTLTLCKDGWFPVRQVVVVALDGDAVAGAAVVHLEPDCNDAGGVSVDAHVRFMQVHPTRCDQPAVTASLRSAIERRANVLGVRKVHGLEVVA